MPIVITTPTSGGGGGGGGSGYDEKLILDPEDEDTGVELDLFADPYGVLEMSFPSPPLETLTVGSISTEGDSIAAVRHQNRQVTIHGEVFAGDQAGMELAVSALESKIAKLSGIGRRPGTRTGTLRRVSSTGAIRTLDILATDSFEPVYDLKRINASVAEWTATLTAAPYARGETAVISTTAETSAGAIVVYFDAPDGDAPALGRLEITDATNGTASQRSAWYGLELDYTPASTRPLVYQAENCTINAGTAGGGTVTWAPAAVTTSAIVTLTAGSAPTHEGGEYRVWARVAINNSISGANVYLGWQAAYGSPGLITNTPASTHVVGNFEFLDLGTVRPRSDINGNWGATIIGQTTTNTQTIQIDHVVLIPTGGANGRIHSTQAFDTAYVAHNQATVDSAVGEVLPTAHLGDYMLIPAAQNEPRQHRLIARMGRRSLLGATGSDYQDPAVDSYGVELSATSRYLTVV